MAVCCDNVTPSSHGVYFCDYTYKIVHALPFPFIYPSRIIESLLLRLSRACDYNSILYVVMVVPCSLLQVKLIQTA